MCSKQPNQSDFHVSTPNDTTLMPTSTGGLWDQNSTEYNLYGCDDPEKSDETVSFVRIMDYLNIYVIPVIIIIGVLGNTLSFFVFVFTHLNRQSSSVYLAFLAAADNLFLISLLFVWFGWVEIHIFQRNGWCQSVIYCTYVCSFLSEWTVLSFTIERYIVAFHPLRRHNLCTRKRAIVAMTSLTFFSLIFYSYSIFIMGEQYIGEVPVCVMDRMYQTLQKAMTSIDTVIALVLPTGAIVALNMAIGIRVYKYTKTLSDKQKTELSLDSFYNSSSCAGGNQEFHSFPRPVLIGHDHMTRESSMAVRQKLNNIRTTSENSRPVKVKKWRLSTRRRQSQMRVTKALLIVSTVFILLNLPSHAFRVQAFVLMLSNGAVSVSAYKLQELLQFAYYLSFSGNFFLYMAFSRNFRRALIRLFRRTKHALQELKPQFDSNRRTLNHPANVLVTQRLDDGNLDKRSADRIIYQT